MRSDPQEGPKVEKSPDAFRTISEAAEELDVPQHVLRFWETRFSQIRPMKRAGGRRYYRPADIELLQGIRSLLYKEGYTIRGVHKILKVPRTSPRLVAAKSCHGGVRMKWPQHRHPAWPRRHRAP
jgi:DNA-binding transcriptional MerR regulator